MNIRKWIYSVLAAIMLVVSLLLFAEYNKFGAKWWIFPVVLVGLALAALIIWIMHHFKLFKSAMEYPKVVAIVLTLGFIICPIMGTRLTEPIREGKSFSQVQEEKANYSYNNTSAGIWYYNTFGRGGVFSGSTGSSTHITSSSSSNNKGMGIVVLIVIVIFLVVGAAVLPHFWVLALIVITCLMIAFAVREWWVERYE